MRFYYYCINCGYEHEIPSMYKSCDQCNYEYRNHVLYSRCKRCGAEKPNNAYGLCLRCFKQVQYLEDKKQRMNG